MKEEYELLRAAFQLLHKQDKSGYVLNLHSQLVNLDADVECDGMSLQEHIKDFLEGEGVDPYEFDNGDIVC